MAARDDYLQAHTEALDKAVRILEALEDLPAPSQKTHYGHVGVVSRINTQLQEVLEIMGASREEAL